MDELDGACDAVEDQVAFGSTYSHGEGFLVDHVCGPGDASCFDHGHVKRGAHLDEAGRSCRVTPLSVWQLMLVAHHRTTFMVGAQVKYRSIG